MLRKLFREPNSLEEWHDIKRGFSSRLVKTECFRALDRLRQKGLLSVEETTNQYIGLQSLLGNMGIVPLTEEILKRTEEPFLAPLGSLDAIHLATALLWREEGKQEFFFATHDNELAMAVKAHGFQVIG